ncbi:(2,3-dihydroxybenzoyl)adenylate synthase [Micromonospora lutea]|uniref:2,3-dihydroxybenzoate-AMP ligase n=1 Tax=Micromonospora lutea TaxID=419825 RepID=A0ABQ4IYL0_9ACTN|nr:AMP-binding protein [Micromonospora lutea]GIJ22937.1 2,3-dihydroxybenzoate-AMP ligase [Micromonospora lutea]
MTTDDGLVTWPEDLAYAYRTAECWRGRPLGDYLWEWADRWGEQVAVVDGDRRLTYRELAELADGLAEHLSENGLRRGHRVLLQLPNCWEFVVVTLACFRLGVAPVMMLPQHREHELSAIAAHVGVRALIVPDRWRDYDHQALAYRVAAGLPGPTPVFVFGEGTRAPGRDGRDLLRADGDVEARRRRLDALAPAGDDVALFLLSGGTTAVPKVIARTHNDYEYNIRRCADVCRFGRDTVYLAVLPIGHNFPLANPGVLGTLYSGGRVVLLPSPRPGPAFAAVETERVTTTSLVPAVAITWTVAATDCGRDLSSLQQVHVGGAMFAPELAAALGPALGCEVQQVYGMAEGLVCYTPVGAPPEVAHRTQGRPLSPFDELLVVEPGTERPVAAGTIGELLTRGPYTPRGYYRAPEQNALSYTAAGWYRTGDLVRLTDGGDVVVCGRIKELINRAGEKISAGEIEMLAQELPEIAEAAAVAMPDPAVGERLCLFVQLHPGRGLTLRRLAAALTARGLAAFKVPERLVVLDELPHTPVGKPDKKALRLTLMPGVDR